MGRKTCIALRLVLYHGPHLPDNATIKPKPLLESYALTRTPPPSETAIPPPNRESICLDNIPIHALSLETYPNPSQLTNPHNCNRRIFFFAAAAAAAVFDQLHLLQQFSLFLIAPYFSFLPLAS